MIILSQRDVRWAGKTIGNSKSLIKDYGCTITSISMLSDFYKCYHDPAWMAKNLTFLVDKVLWNSISEKLCFKFVWRFYKYDEAKIWNALDGETTSCLLEIQKKHWVVGIRKIGNYYWCADPWTASRRLINKNLISGGATFKK
jgi:hypothetical protein